MTKRSDFQIDELDIQTEWARQPDLVKEYGDNLADCQREFESAKAALSVAKAEAYKAIRKEPRKFGIDKLTEKALELALPTHPAVISAVADEIDARHARDIAKSACDALDHKRTSMSNIMELIQSGLFAEPRTPKRKDRSEDARSRGLRNRERRRSSD